jgi:hypothetical protein
MCQPFVLPSLNGPTEQRPTCGVTLRRRLMAPPNWAVVVSSLLTSQASALARL